MLTGHRLTNASTDNWTLDLGAGNVIEKEIQAMKTEMEFKNDILISESINEMILSLVYREERAMKSGSSRNNKPQTLQRMLKNN